jgi:hypothetical protein
MLRLTCFGAGLLASSMFAASALAEPTQVTITVEKAKPAGEEKKAPFHGERPAVDVAILLDTSNSMDGLINQAKSQLWTIVQQFAKAKKEGKTPELRVALFEYGNTRLPASEGFIRQVVPLTDDLDKLSEALFGLTTSGGDEYCGQVIDEAITRLDWSKARNGYKAIFIAGNEPFTQGPVDYRAACKRAIEKGVVVNTIHCGNSRAGINGQWQHGSQLAEGESFNIDQDRAVVEIKCPQDAVIIKLSTALNDTYLWYGVKHDRTKYAENQRQQDGNASGVSGSTAVTRGVTKANSAYGNRGRDLVDSMKEDKEVLAKIKDEELPEAMQKMTLAERQKCVEENAKKRAQIQKQINDLTAEREKYIAEQRKLESTTAKEDTLGDAVCATVRKQLAKCGFDNEAAK